MGEEPKKEYMNNNIVNNTEPVLKRIVKWIHDKVADPIIQQYLNLYEKYHFQKLKEIRNYSHIGHSIKGFLKEDIEKIMNNTIDNLLLELKEIIIKYAKKYNLKKVLLFGSSAHNDNYYDIDIGISGINQKDFFNLYGDLLMALPKRIDVINLDKDNKVNRIIEQEGVGIYG